MALRPTQSSAYDQVRRGISYNTFKLGRAQEQIASGKRILRPSDDSVGTSFALSLRRRLGNVNSMQQAIESSMPFLQTAATSLEQGSQLLGEARAVIVQAVNGTLNQQNRDALADQLELVRSNLLDLANERSGERYLFAGTETGTRPFETVVVDGQERVVYRGNREEQKVLVGRDLEVSVNVDGEAVFGKFGYSGTEHFGVSGAARGTSADSGTGYHTLHVRHNATSGYGAGIVSAAGAMDTILGDHALVVDATAGTIRLGTGTTVAIPASTEAAYSDLELTDADGSSVRIDLSGWSGADFSGTLTGDGSVALSDGSFVALDFSATDLELTDASGRTVVHLDTTGITRSGEDLVNFTGAINLFDTLQGAIDDLRSGDSLDTEQRVERGRLRRKELDRGSPNLLVGLGRIGSRMERMNSTEQRLAEVEVHLTSLVSSTEDADFSEVALELSRAEFTLQAAQASGARLIQQTLLNYLR
jgi:flagellar hook-associated protein 3 FlgL